MKKPASKAGFLREKIREKIEEKRCAVRFDFNKPSLAREGGTA